MPATKVNISQIVDLVTATPELGAAKFNFTLSVLHALRRLNIVDGEANLNNFYKDILSASGDHDDGEESVSERSCSMPTPSTGNGRRTPLEMKVANIQEQLGYITSNKQLFEKTRTQYQEKPMGEMWLNMQLMSRMETSEKGIAKCMSMIEDMTKQMQALSLRDEHKKSLIEDMTKQMQALKDEKKKSMIEVMTKEMQALRDEQKKSMIENMTKEMQALRDEHKKSVIEDMTKEMQALRDEHKKSVIEDMTKEMQDFKDAHKKSMIEVMTKEMKCMSMIEEMTKEMQALRDEHQESMIEDMTKEMQTLRDEHQESMIEDMTKEMQALRDEHQESMIEDMTKEMQALRDEHQESMIEDMTKEIQALRDEHQESMIEDMTKEMQALRDEHKKSVIEDMTKEMQALRDEHKKQMDQIKGPSRRPTSSHSVPWDTKIMLYKLGESHEALTRRVEELECMSMIDDGTKEMQALRDEHKKQMDQIKGLNIDELLKRLNTIEKSMNEMNDTFNTLPSPDDLAQSVTWAGLEDALQGIRQDCEDLQKPTERVVIEMSSQTDPVAKMRKKLDQGALDGLNVSLEKLEQLQELKEQVDALAAAREKDHDVLLKSKNVNREKIKKLFAYCDKLQVNKADRTEVDVKVDKRTLYNKVNNSLFDTKSIDTSKKIQEILDKMAVNEEAWADIDGKLDGLELDQVLKEWLLRRLSILNDRLKKQNQAPVEWVDDDVAGIRRQLIQKYNCISSNRPIDIMPTGLLPSSMPFVPSNQALHPTRSQRLHSTSEKDQTRQHANSDTNTCTSNDRSPSKMCKSDLKAFQVHFGNDDAFVEGFQKNASIDYAHAEIANNVAKNRYHYDGQPTTTNPHKLLTKRPNLSSTIIKEDEETKIYPLYKEDVDVQGADGNIYKGRLDCPAIKLPLIRQATQNPSLMQRSPQSMRHKVMPEVRKSSAKLPHLPRPPPKNGSRPQSAHLPTLHATHGIF